VENLNKSTEFSDNKLLHLRPTLALETNVSNDIEKFQNTSLRPVLKFLHNTLLQLFNEECNYKKLNPIAVNEMETREWLKLKFSKNLEFRNTISGMVISLLTQSELEIYFKSKNEFNRRIFTMALERIASTVHS
jgi:hypothetical protein